MLMELQVSRALGAIALALEAPFIPASLALISGRARPALPPSPGMAIVGLVLAILALLLSSGIYSLEDRPGRGARLVASLGMVIATMLLLAGGVGAFVVHHGAVVRVLLGLGNAGLVVILLRFLSPWVIRSR